MAFNTLVFLYLFLPFTLFFVYISSEKLKNPFLLLASWIFYAWGGVTYSAILICVTVINYFIGRVMGSAILKPRRKSWLVLGIIMNLLPLIIFKFVPFFGDSISAIGTLFGATPFVLKGLILPLGISFYSFKSITYLISVYRKETEVQRNYIDLALYISIFPQVMAGPIDRYRSLLPQLHNRTTDFERFASGIRRFTIGLAKKVIIANSLALVADDIFSRPIENIDTPLAWLGAICYALQIYYDFAGYTDMAIGLGRMFGFDFMENFNFPYLSKSVKEFWQRWHISLSTWLRDYLFLPVAYSTSRKMPKERYLGIRADKLIYLIGTSLTFLVCGFWHGAAWNFVIWGLLHGFMLILEHFRFGKWLKKSAKPVQHLYMILFILISWVFFRTATLENAFQYIGVMFGGASQPADLAEILEYFNPGFILTFIIAILGSTRFFMIIVNGIEKANGSRILILRGLSFHAFSLGSLIAVLATLALSTLYILSGSHMSFIYFKF